MKRFLALLLVAGVLATPVLADEPLSLVPAVNDYTQAGYADVTAGSWYAAPAQVCYETGLMTGTQAGFEPTRTLSLAEAAAIAARLRQALVGDTIPDPQTGAAWYQNYEDYLAQAAWASGSSLYGVIPWGEAAGFSAPATRYDFLVLLSLAVEEHRSSLPAINAITALPDVGEDNVALFFYNAGVLTGKDDYGTFDPQGTLSRSECAAMVARVVRPGLRLQFTPQTPPAPEAPSAGEPPLSYEEEFLRTEALRVNGAPIPFSLFLDTLNDRIFKTDFALAAQGGGRLDWDAQYPGIDDLEIYFISQALDQAVQEYLLAYQAKALNCAVEDLPKALTPDPAAALGKVYRAKHILVKDQATAQALLAQLMANPSEKYFDQLMGEYNTDPGMTSNPDGYLFTDGDMVASFENAVKSLKIGACTSAPVPSDFGWHIILRLDPTTYPDWEKAVQAMLYEKYVEQWVASATVTPNNAELLKLDVRGRYEQYLAQMGL